MGSRRISYRGHRRNCPGFFVQERKFKPLALLASVLRQSGAPSTELAPIVRRVDLAAAYQGDRLQMGTWIVESSRGLKMTRRFQLRRPADGLTLLCAQTTFACIELSSGRPRRMPEAFVERYGRALVDV